MQLPMDIPALHAQMVARLRELAEDGLTFERFMQFFCGALMQWCVFAYQFSKTLPVEDSPRTLMQQRKKFVVVRMRALYGDANPDWPDIPGIPGFLQGLIEQVIEEVFLTVVVPAMTVAFFRYMPFPQEETA